MPRTLNMMQPENKASGHLAILHYLKALCRPCNPGYPEGLCRPCNPGYPEGLNGSCNPGNPEGLCRSCSPLLTDTLPWSAARCRGVAPACAPRSTCRLRLGRMGQLMSAPLLHSRRTTSAWPAHAKGASA